MSDGRTPWFEPGAGEAADIHNNEDLKAAAMASVAVTFKRLVDMCEPFAKAALVQLQADMAVEAKAKGKK